MPTTLISKEQKERLKFPHFPDAFLGVIWRCWGQFSAEKLAKVLETTPENIKSAAEQMGLDKNIKVNDNWKKRGYITVIRNMWQLLTFDQIAELLEVSHQSLDTTLKEEDFLYHKMGNFVPQGDKTVFRELTESEKKEVLFMRESLSKYQAVLDQNPDNAFGFIEEYYKKADDVPRFVNDINGDLRMIYPYFALYGDPLIEEDCNPFPDKLLEEYARYGINGIWMQAVLYQLTPYPFAPELSEGWEKRLDNLAKIVKRAKKYGIGIYLYLNEPRMMPDRVFEKHPHLKGHSRPDMPGMSSMCTSTPEVQEYLENAIYELFKKAEGLAGYFTISVSENQTNCYSHSTEETCTCPRCKERTKAEVVAEVNNIMARGAHRANPNARAVAWNWAWPVEQMSDIIEKLDKNIILQCTSESKMKICKGGIENEIHDYTISNPGPGELAKNAWKIAKENGHECSAKCQFNCSWELPNVPFVPAFDLMSEYAKNLKNADVKHLMLSWTMGGAPSPNIRLVCDILSGRLDNVKEFINELYPGEMSEIVLSAQSIFSAAFRQFPFHISVAYTAPQTSGPKSPFFVEPTGWSATMTCFPYDSIDYWRANYPRDVFEKQFSLVVRGWRVALDIMESYKGEKNDSFNELYNMMLGSYVHYVTNLNLIRFVIRRDEAIKSGYTNEDIDYLLALLDDEEKNVVETIKLQSRDSRIGFEAANHYCFTRQDLTEKLLNIAWCKRYYREKRGN